MFVTLQQIWKADTQNDRYHLHIVQTLQKKPITYYNTLADPGDHSRFNRQNFQSFSTPKVHAPHKVLYPPL